VEDLVKIDRKVSSRPRPRQFYALRAIASGRYVTLVGLALASLTASANAQVLPPDAASLCQFKPSEFASWFESGVVTTEGSVTPADSLHFNFTQDVPPNHTHCNFHKWAARMFLWLTSPRDNGRVFQSPEFYIVSPPEDGKRRLTQNAPDKEDIRLFLRSSKVVELGGMAGAGQGVLMAQNKSLVYTLSFVNDVYAYFLTGAKNGALKDTRFPIQSEELEAIKAFARGHTTLGHPEVLAIEIKSAWVETAGLREAGLDPSKYIRMNALIPIYDTSDPTQQKWTLTNDPPKKTELALVGMHIVGSTSGHPDMTWATFEHVDNVPIAPYRYKRANDVKDSAPSQGPWLFSRRDASGPFNERHMHARHDPNIEAEPDNTIGPSDTRRENAWGGSPNDHEHNSRVISINMSTMQILPSDVRANYLLIGTVWNSGAGSARLANTTLETYEQAKNCFFCHVTTTPSQLSRIYESLQPLFSQAPR
jgi:hypothetical protein